MKEVLNALNIMYNIERAATAIYKAQVRAFSGEIADRLIAAAINEQEHVDDLKARIEELGGSVSRLGGLFQLGGMSLGFATTLMGKMSAMKADGWVERKAVKDYGGFLERVDFDAKSRALIEKNIEDEKRHIQNWLQCADMLKGRRGD